MKIPEAWDIINTFKKRCQPKGWEIAEHEDLIKSCGKYHNFLWIRELRPSTFESVTKHKKYAIQEGVNYRTVNVSFTAWICSKILQCESLIQIMFEHPEILKRNAIYDLSQAPMDGICRKFNETESEVFKEFELFLKDEFGIKIQTIS